MFAKELRQAGHTKRFTISEAGSEGWEVRVEQDSEVVRRVHYTDWHRVERAVLMLSLQVSELENNGWLETRQADCALRGWPSLPASLCGIALVHAILFLPFLFLSAALQPQPTGAFAGHVTSRIRVRRPWASP